MNAALLGESCKAIAKELKRPRSDSNALSKERQSRLEIINTSQKLDTLFSNNVMGTNFEDAHPTFGQNCDSPMRRSVR